VRRRIQFFDFSDAKVIGIVRHGLLQILPAGGGYKKSRQIYAGGFF